MKIALLIIDDISTICVLILGATDPFFVNLCVIINGQILSRRRSRKENENTNTSNKSNNGKILFFLSRVYFFYDNFSYNPLLFKLIIPMMAFSSLSLPMV